MQLYIKSECNEKRIVQEIKWSGGNWGGKFAVLNEVVRLKLLEMLQFEYPKVIGELDMWTSGVRSCSAKALRQEYSGMF